MTRSKVRHIILGPPGTGKTFTLLQEVQRHLQAGVAPDRIGFVSFSRRAVREARERAQEVTTAELPHFRTIHATAYHLLGLERGDVVAPRDLTELGQLIGMPFGAVVDTPVWEGALGDRCLAVASLAAARGTTLRQEWEGLNGDLPWQLVLNTVTWYNQYKSGRELWDFNDMVGKAEGLLDVDVLFVDEAQDTSAAQWALLRRVAAHVPVVYFAGDDDQAVYHWSGADPYQLMRFMGDRRVLAQSYRLPRAVKAFADSLAQRIQLRLPKPYAPRDEEGAVDWVNDLDKIDLRGAESYLLLARSNYQLGKLRHMARQQGVVYSLSDGKWSWNLPSVQAALTYEQLRRGRMVPRKAVQALNAFLDHKLTVPRQDELAWEHVFGEAAKDRPWFDALTAMPVEDREYVRALRRGGESLTKPGRVRIGTVHSVKGAEADHVVLLTDVSRRVLEGMRLNADAEHRVQYVAATRARRTLTLIRPQTTSFWPFP